MDTPEPTPPPEPLPPPRRAPSVLTFAVVLAVVFGAVFLVRAVVLPGDPFDRELLQHVDHVNATAPIKISEEVRLTGATAGPGRVLTNIYTYTVFTKPRDFDPAAFAEENRLALVDRYRTDPGLKKFRDNGLTIRAQYVETNGELLGEIEAKASD